MNESFKLFTYVEVDIDLFIILIGRIPMTHNIYIPNPEEGTIESTICNPWSVHEYADCIIFPFQKRRDFAITIKGF